MFKRAVAHYDLEGVEEALKFGINASYSTLGAFYCKFGEWVVNFIKSPDGLISIFTIGSYINDANIYDGSIPWTMLQYTSAAGNSAIVSLLLNRGADWKIQDKTGRTALDIARFFKRDEVADVLEQHIFNMHYPLQKRTVVLANVSFRFK